MSDDINQTEEAVGTAEAVDTSTNEETQDTEAEDLDNFILTDDMITAGDDTEESEVTEETEPASEETEEAEEESTSDVESEDSSEESSDESETVESKEDGTPSEEEIKAHNAEMARQRIAEREARERAKLEAQQEYLQSAEDEKDLALKQLQIDAYNNRVETNTNKLQLGIDRAVATIDLFTKGSPEVQEELANSLDDFERMYVQRDRNGDPIAVNGDVYQYLQAKAESIKRIQALGARQEAKAKSETKARTITPPVKTPKEPKVDPMIAAFDEEASRW